ncbi:hypothetical protein AB0L88_44440 [Saccharopolyspora shandongensis]|uniref:hypothetical protein n=1 Tax=Saccharopolyspora shandongensis TaxID=418495 RepID=UPI00341ED6FC
MSDYPEPQRGDWVTFHRAPVYGATCHRACRSSGGHKGFPWVGQVGGRHHELVHGRPAYRIRYWHDAKNGQREALTTVLPADRLIAITKPPCGMPVLVPTTRIDLEGAA